MNTTTALTIHSASTALSKEQKADFWGQAQALIKAGLFPEKFENAEQAFMVALYGHELHLSPQRAWKQIHLIKGQPALEVHLQVAMVREAVPSLIWKITEHTDKVCTITHGRTKDDVQETSFTWAEAEAAGLTTGRDPHKKTAWQKDPKSMLYARAAGRAVRWFYPETQGGGLIHNVDEMRDAFTDTAPATVADKVEEAKTGEGRMPKRGPVVDVTPEPATAKPAAPETETEPPATPAPAQAESKPSTAVEDLRATLERTNNPNDLDRAYGNWRAGQTDPVVLIQGYDAKEARARALQHP